MANADDDFRWDDLRYFLHAVRAKTLAGAARSMGVEHTTIGRRLSAIEQSIGAPLVLRSPGGLQLTPLGERVLPLVEEVERAVHAVREAAAAQKARVRLAVPSGFTKFFADRLSSLHEAHPELALELISGARLVDLTNGEADLALRAGSVHDEELVARKLIELGWSLYASASYLARRSYDERGGLDGHALIGFDPSLANTPAARWLSERVAPAAIVLRSREIADLVAAAVGGAGLALLPCALGDVEPRLRRLSASVLVTQTMSLVYRRNAQLAAPVRAVIEFVRRVVLENAAHLSGEGSALGT